MLVNVKHNLSLTNAVHLAHTAYLLAKLIRANWANMHVLRAVSRMQLINTSVVHTIRFSAHVQSPRIFSLAFNVAIRL